MGRKGNAGKGARRKGKMLSHLEDFLWKLTKVGGVYDEKYVGPRTKMLNPNHRQFKY